MGALDVWHVAILGVCALIPLALGATITLVVMHTRNARRG